MLITTISMDNEVNMIFDIGYLNNESLHPDIGDGYLFLFQFVRCRLNKLL